MRRLPAACTYEAGSTGTAPASPQAGPRPEERGDIVPPSIPVEGMGPGLRLLVISRQSGLIMGKRGL